MEVSQPARGVQADFIEKVKGFSYSVLCPPSPSGLMWMSMLALGLFIWEMGGHRLEGAWVPNLPLKEDVLKIGSTGFILFMCFPSSYLLSKETSERGGRS